MPRKSGILRAYHDFASAFGTAWLVVIALAFLTGGRIGRWGALILPIQMIASLGYAAFCGKRRRLRERSIDRNEVKGVRFFPI